MVYLIFVYITTSGSRLLLNYTPVDVPPFQHVPRRRISFFFFFLILLQLPWLLPRYRQVRGRPLTHFQLPTGATHPICLPVGLGHFFSLLGHPVLHPVCSFHVQIRFAILTISGTGTQPPTSDHPKDSTRTQYADISINFTTTNTFSIKDWDHSKVIMHFITCLLMLFMYKNIICYCYLCILKYVLYLLHMFIDLLF